MLASARLLELTALTGTQTARDHFMSITTGGGTLSGSIGLDINRWQEIAIPVTGVRVKEYFLDRVLSTVQIQTPTATLEDIFEVVKAFPANDATQGTTLAFVPGVTNPAASGNFYLITQDGTSDEITGFLCKTRDYSNVYTGEIVFEWDSNDGV